MTAARMRRVLLGSVGALGIACGFGARAVDADGAWGWDSGAGCEANASVVRIAADTIEWIEQGRVLARATDLRREVSPVSSENPQPAQVLWLYTLNGVPTADQFYVSFRFGTPLLTFSSRNGARDAASIPHLNEKLRACTD